jgi:hypothetical protein
MARVRKSKSQGAKKSQGANTQGAKSQGAKKSQMRIGARHVSGAITNFSKNFSGKMGGSRKMTIQEFESMYSNFLESLIVDANGAETIPLNGAETIPFDELYSRIKDAKNPTLLVSFLAYWYFNFVKNRSYRENILVGMLTDQNTKDFISLCQTEEYKKELESIINSIVEWLRTFVWFKILPWRRNCETGGSRRSLSSSDFWKKAFIVTRRNAAASERVSRFPFFSSIIGSLKTSARTFFSKIAELINV